MGDVAIAEGGRGFKGLIGDAQAVMLLVALTQSSQDFDGFFDRRFTNIDGLETSFQGGIPLNVLAVLIQCGGSNALQLTSGESRFEDVGGINGTFCRTSTNQCVHFVDHKDHVARSFDLLHDFFEAFLKFAPVFGAGHQKTDVKGENTLVFQDVGNITLLDALSQTFGYGSFANPGLSDQDRIVFGAATKDLDDAINFVMASNHRIELGFAGQLGEVAAEFIECGCFGGSLGTGTTTASSTHLSGFAQHPDDLGPDLGEINTEIFEDTRCNTFTFTDQP